MIELTEDVLAEVRAHATGQLPFESCGVLVVRKGRLRYHPCRNVEDDPRQGFEIHPEDEGAAEALGDVVAYVHSHPFAAPDPSDADLVGCEASGLPWVIVNAPVGHYRQIEPSGYVAPYEGRTYSWGVLDCYSLVRDWYARELGVDLPDFHRPRKFWEKGLDLYEDNWARCGFRPVGLDQLERGDVVLFRHGSDIQNHAGVFLGEGGFFLHHPMGRYSGRDLLAGYWRKVAGRALRYSLPQGGGRC